MIADSEYRWTNNRAYIGLKRAADLGYVPAIFELGWAYETGGGVPQDLPKAIKYYDQAAGYGQPEALVALGNLYGEGHGVKVDRQKSLMYYIVAANYGYPDAKPLVTKAEAQLTPKQIKSAQDDAAKFATSSKRPLVPWFASNGPLGENRAGLTRIRCELRLVTICSPPV